MIIRTSWSSRYILIINVIIMRIRKKSRIIMRMKMKMRIKGEIGKLRWIWWCGVVGGVWQKCYREPIFPPLRIWWMGTFRSGRGAPATTLGRHQFILDPLTYLPHIHSKWYTCTFDLKFTEKIFSKMHRWGLYGASYHIGAPPLYTGRS